MKVVRFRDGADAAPSGSSSQRVQSVLIDLDERVTPQSRAHVRRGLAALAGSGAEVSVRLPACPDDADIDLLSEAGIATVVLGDVRTPEEVDDWNRRTHAAGMDHGLVLELRSGQALVDLERLLRVRGEIRGIWYAPADLVVEFAEDPRDMYYFDWAESRLAAPRWNRSRVLTFARAFDMELWGQLDVTVTDVPVGRLADSARLASLSGFDVLVASERAVLPDSL